MHATYPVFGVVVFKDTTFMRRECSLMVEALYWLETSLHRNTYVQAHTHTHTHKVTHTHVGAEHTRLCCSTVVAGVEHNIQMMQCLYDAHQNMY